MGAKVETSLALPYRRRVEPADRAVSVRAGLDAFEAAWVSGDRRAIYEAALSAWRAWPAPALAELVERGAERFGNAMSASRSQSSWKARFVERARSAEPYEIAGLLRSLEQQRPSRVQLTSCIVELPSAERDPAVGRAALGLAMGEALGGAGWSVLARKLILWAEGSGDPRLVEAIDAWLVRLQRTTSTDAYSAKLRGWLEQARKALAEREAAPLPAPEVERAVALAARFDGPLPRAKRKVDKAAPSDLEALERAVMENPNDDALLAVWSDALQRAEDPRGELIALQLAGALDERAQKLVAKLITKHWRNWLGPVAVAVVPGSVVFERGLFAACTTRVLRHAQVTIFSHPRWATLRRITFGGAGVLTATMPLLEEARGLPAGALARSERLVFPSLRLLDLKASSWPIRSLARLTNMPALRTLILEVASREVFTQYADTEDGPAYVPFTSDVYASLLETPIIAQLEHLALPLDWLDKRWLRPALAHLVSQLRARAPNLRRLDLDAIGSGTLALDLERGSGVVESGGFRDTTLTRGRAVIEALGLRFVVPE